MEFPIVPTHRVAVIHGTHAYISLKTPLSHKSLSRFCICIGGAAEVNYSQLPLQLEKQGETHHTQSIFSTLEILRQKAKNFKMTIEYTLSYTKHCLVCDLRPLETPAKTGPVQSEGIVYALNFFASDCLTCIFRILHWSSFGCSSQLYKTGSAYTGKGQYKH